MDELQKQKQMEETIVVQKEEVMPHMMKHLEQWEVPGDQTLGELQADFLERTLLQQKQYNEILLESLNKTATPRQVTRTAPVEVPPVQLPVAQETRKQRREREKTLKKARKACPVGDEHTLHLANSLRTMDDGKGASMKLYLNREQAAASHSDLRMLKVFCHGVQMKSKTKFKTPADERYARLDQTFLEDYVSGDQQRRKPHLERITKEMLSIQFSPDMFSPEYLLKHPSQLKDLGDKMVYFENLQKANPDFFDNLPQVEKDLLKAQEPLFVAFTGAVSQHFNARGIDFNKSKVYGHHEMTPIEMGLQSRDMMTQMYQGALEEYGEKTRAALLQEVDRRVAHYEQENQRGNDEMIAEIKQESSDISDIEFSGNVTFYQYEDLQKIRTMFTANPEPYAANKELLDTIYRAYFQTLDMMGKLVYKGRAIQGAIDQTKDERMSYSKALERLLSARDDANVPQVSLLQNRAMSLGDLMSHYLSGKEVSPAAATVIGEFRTVAPTEPPPVE